jgi:hypothetical protein
MAAGRKPRSRNNAGIVALSVGLALSVLCVCGGLAAFMAFAFGQAAEPARRQVDPWLRLLVEERYDEAARECGSGVTGEQLRAAVDRGVGAPLRSFEPKGGAQLSFNVGAGTEGYTMTYRMQGSQRSATVTVRYAEDTIRGLRKIAIADWGIDPELARVRQGRWGEAGWTPESTTAAPRSKGPVGARTGEAEKSGQRGLRLPSSEPEAEAPE